MPRDAQGAYALPPGTLVNSGDTVLPSQHNPAFNDVAAALTGSLARSGAGGMLGELPMNGFAITNMAPGTASGDAATVAQVSNAGKIGALVFWPLNTVPSDCLVPNGGTASRTTYPELFAAYGTTFGVGDGSTTFGLPDFRGASPMAADNMGGTAANRTPQPRLLAA